MVSPSLKTPVKNQTMNKLSIFSKCLIPLGVLATGLNIQAQSVDIIYLSREVTWEHVDASTLQLFQWDPPYSVWAGAELSSGEIGDFQISAGTENTSIPANGEGGYEVGLLFETEEEMSAMFGSGTYTFSGTGSTAGAFSFSTDLLAYSPLTVKKILNWEALQSADPTGPVVIEWEPFADAGDMGFIQVSIGYPTEDGGYVEDFWEAPTNRSDGLPGLTTDTTSLTIPANTLVGSDFNQFDARVSFMSLAPAGDSAPFEGAGFVTGTLTETAFNIFTTTSAPVLPVLAISRSGDNVVLTWEGDGFILETTTSLTEPNWVRTPYQTGSPNTAAADITSANAGFYRLVK